MRAVVQRTTSSSVTINGTVTGSIDTGLMVLLGIGQGDTKEDADYIMDKIANLRIFSDEYGKMNRSVQDVAGSVLLVSQFTLYGDARKGRRPSFTDALMPKEALPLFKYCIEALCQYGIPVATGVFGADMRVHIDNDGPCTILLDSNKLF